MSLTLIGLGLDPNDLSARAIETIRSSESVLLETYTSASSRSLEELTALVGKQIIALTRSMVEQDDIVLENARSKDTVLLIFGDPLAATTHIELILRARASGIETSIIHAPSIFSAIGEAGLELYRYGKTASIVYPRKNWLPTSAAELIVQNRSLKAHTLVLLDIVTGAEEFALLDKDHEVFSSIDKSLIEHETKSLADEPQLLMSPNEAIAILLSQGAISEDETLIVCSRLGSDSSHVQSASSAQLLKSSFGLGPHAIVVPGAFHFLEEEYLASLKNDQADDDPTK